MDDARGQAGQTAQRGRRVQIAQQRRDAAPAQILQALGATRQGQHARAPSCGTRTGDGRARQCTSHAQPHVAAADDEHAFASKARRQRAQWVLV